MGTLMPSSVNRQSHVVVTRRRNLLRTVARTSGRSPAGRVLIGRSVRLALYCILALITGPRHFHWHLGNGEYRCCGTVQNLTLS